jgi:hypothetical protein
MATKKIKRFESGGVSDKDRGLEASKDDKVGFFERMRMGNIDEEGSEAYNRFGAGRGKAERTPVEDRVATPVVRESAAAATSAPTPDMDPMQEANAREPIPVPAGPKARPGEVGSSVRIGGKPSVGSAAPAKSPPKQAQAYSRTSGDTGARPKADTSNYSNEGRGREMTKQQQFEKADAEARSPEGVAKRKKQESDQGLERVTPETALLPGGGLRALSEAAKRLAAPKMAKYAQEALPAPTKRLSYDKAGAFSRKRSERADARREEMLKENARRYGLDEDAPGYQAAADAVRKGLGGKDFGLKKGGSLKRSAPVKKMASGGMVSNASKRADGIATKGKTRCKMR